MSYEEAITSVCPVTSDGNSVSRGRWCLPGFRTSIIFPLKLISVVGKSFEIL